MHYVIMIGVIVGILFLINKYYREKIELELYDKKIAAVERAFKNGSAAWESHVVDHKLDEEIEDKLRYEPGFLNSVETEMKEEFGDMYISKLGYPSYSPTAARYLLAKQGKLKPFDASSFGISVVGIQKYSREDKLRWKREVNFINWMHEEIKKHGVDARLMFKSGAIINSTPVEASKVEEYDGGSFFWSSAAYSTYRRYLMPTKEEIEKAEKFLNSL